MVNEVLNIGLSHRANHLLTQFYNVEESLLYSKNNDNDKRIIPSTQLHAKIDKINKLVDYTPRCLLWDAKNGNGSLGKYQYSINNADDYYYNQKNDNTGEDGSLKVQVENRVPRSQFQQNLDNGLVSVNDPHIENMNNPSNYQYWSDYNKLIYDPHSLMNCKNWYHNKSSTNGIPTNVPLTGDGNDANSEGSFFTYFNNSKAGSEEYNSCKNDLWDENLHFWLEQSDRLNHINIVSEFDNAWGAASNRLLSDLKDELPKTSIFQFSLSNIQSSTSDLLNIITNTLTCLENIELLFPLYYDRQAELYDESSQQALIFQTINSVFDISSKNKLPYNPTDLTNILTIDNKERKIVTNIISEHGTKDAGKDFNYFANYKIPSSNPGFKPWKLKKIRSNIFHECTIIRNNDFAEKKNSGESTQNQLQTYQIDYENLNTFFTTKSKETFDLKTLQLQIKNDPIVDIFKYWKFLLSTNYVKKLLVSSPTSTLSHIEDVEEMVETVESLKNAYTVKTQYSLYDSDEESDEDPDEEYHI